MPETITLYAESIEDISPINHDSLEITLADVDLGQLIQEIGYENLLAEIDRKDVEQYYKDKDTLEGQDGE